MAGYRKVSLLAQPVESGTSAPKSITTIRIRRQFLVFLNRLTLIFMSSISLESNLKAIILIGTFLLGGSANV